jgi:hypothetical protein
VNVLFHSDLQQYIGECQVHDTANLLPQKTIPGTRLGDRRPGLDDSEKNMLSPPGIDQVKEKTEHVPGAYNKEINKPN